MTTGPYQQCPVDGCPTMLQRTQHQGSTIEDGINEHLRVVHPRWETDEEPPQ